MELCEFICDYLTLHNFLTITTSKSDQLIHFIEKEKPDLVILDILMPGVDGLSLCKRIREDHHIPILFLTGLNQNEERIKGFEAGADDYITKPFELGELLARIKANLRWARQIKRGSNDYDKKQILKFTDLTIDLLTYKITAHNKEVHLQPKEVQILILLATKPQRVFSQEQLHSLIWGDMSFSSLDTVKVHIRNIRKKIDLDPSKPGFIETERGFGYRFIGK